MSGRISTNWLRELQTTFMANGLTGSTQKNYNNVWKNFNEFLIKLDILPVAWEERIALYCVFLTEYTGIQSRTLKSYVSAIKKKLTNIGYRCNDDLIWLSSLTRAL